MGCHSLKTQREKFPIRNKWIVLSKKRSIIPEQEFIRKPTMMTNTTDIGKQIQRRRKSLGITQRELALTSGTGIRFIVELEQGKAT